MNMPKYVKIIATDTRQSAVIELAMNKLSNNEFCLAGMQVDVELIDGDSISGQAYINANKFQYPYVIMSVSTSQFNHPFVVSKPLKHEILFDILSKCIHAHQDIPKQPFFSTNTPLINNKLKQAISPVEINQTNVAIEKPKVETKINLKSEVKSEEAKPKNLKSEKTQPENIQPEIQSDLSELSELSLSSLINMQKENLKSNPPLHSTQLTPLDHKPDPLLQTSNTLTESTSPKASSLFSNEIDTSIYFGNTHDTHINDAYKNTIGEFNFKYYLAYHIASIAFSKAAEEKIIAFDIDGSIIILSIAEDTCYCGFSENTFHAFAISPFPNAPKHTFYPSIHAAMMHYGKQKPKYKMSAQLFLSKMALLAARGRLPTNTNIDQKIFINIQPDISKFVPIPGIIRVFSLWSMTPTSLLETCTILDLPQKYVFSIYLMALVLGLFKDKQDDPSFHHLTDEHKQPDSDISALLAHIKSL